MGELVIGVDIGAVFLAGVLETENGTVLAGLRVQHAHAVDILDGIVDFLEDFGAFAACAEGIDGNGHADEKCYEE